MPPSLTSLTSRTALPALSALRVRGSSTLASPARSFLSRAGCGGSYCTQTRRNDPESKTTFFSSAVPGSNRGFSAAAQGSAMYDDSKTDQAERRPSEHVLDGMDSVYSMDLPNLNESGLQTSCARTAHGNRASNAIDPSIVNSVSVPYRSNLDPRDGPHPDSDEAPPSSTRDSSKPSLIISSIGPDGKTETHLFRLHGRSASQNCLR
jgi:hypothetical protein